MAKTDDYMFFKLRKNAAMMVTWIKTMLPGSPHVEFCYNIEGQRWDVVLKLALPQKNLGPHGQTILKKQAFWQAHVRPDVALWLAYLEARGVHKQWETQHQNFKIMCEQENGLFWVWAMDEYSHKTDDWIILVFPPTSDYVITVREPGRSNSQLWEKAQRLTMLMYALHPDPVEDDSIVAAGKKWVHDYEHNPTWPKYSSHSQA